MTVHLPADVEASIRQQVASGRFGDEVKVVRVALRLLEARERRMRQTRDSVAEGLAAIERGEGIELTPDLMDELEREADELHRQGKQPKPDVCPYTAACLRPRRTDRPSGRVALHTATMGATAARRLPADVLPSL